MKDRTALIKKKLHKTFSSIRGRILLITISLILLISIIITFISYFLISYNLQQNLIQTADTQLSFLCSSIDSNINDVKAFVDSCRRSSKIRNFALETPSAGNRIRREAHDFAMEGYASNSSLPNDLIRMVIMGNRRKDIIQIVESPYSSISVSSDAIKALPYYDFLRDHMEETPTGVMTDPFFTTKEIPMIPIVHGISHPYNADEIGCIFTEISLSVITGPVHDLQPQTEGRLYITINDYTYRITDQSLTLSDDAYDTVRSLSAVGLGSGTVVRKVRSRGNADTADASPGTGESFFMIRKPLQTSNWYITEYIDTRQLSQNIYRTFFIIMLAILAASSAIGLILFRFLSRTVDAPVKQLQARIRRIEEGDFSRDPSTEWEHELGEIGKTINDLSENVLQLMQRQLEDERQKRDYEYRMLQSQINPHFLYNTLNSIKWMATTQNAPGIAQMTVSLFRLLKDISKGASSLVTIEHELSLINDYFTIQQYRYGGTISLDCQIDDDSLLTCRILKFTLQPLVENAIFHGIEPKGTTGKIRIHLYADPDGDIHIDVTDDGVGIRADLAAHLLDSEAPASSSFFKEIGLSNVHKRLQYEFGDRYGLTISSEEGRFTTVSILLPNR